MSSPTSRGELLQRLVDHSIDFVIVGGEATVAHGSATVTQDLDIVARMEPDNIAPLLAALEGLAPAFVTRPDLPFD